MNTSRADLHQEPATHNSHDTSHTSVELLASLRNIDNPSQLQGVIGRLGSDASFRNLCDALVTHEWDLGDSELPGQRLVCLLGHDSAERVLNMTSRCLDLQEASRKLNRFHGHQRLEKEDLAQLKAMIIQVAPLKGHDNYFAHIRASLRSDSSYLAGISPESRQALLKEFGLSIDKLPDTLIRAETIFYLNAHRVIFEFEAGLNARKGALGKLSVLQRMDCNTQLDTLAELERRLNGTPGSRLLTSRIKSGYENLRAQDSDLPPWAGELLERVSTTLALADGAKPDYQATPADLWQHELLPLGQALHQACNVLDPKMSLGNGLIKPLLRFTEDDPLASEKSAQGRNLCQALDWIASVDLPAAFRKLPGIMGGQSSRLESMLESLLARREELRLDISAHPGMERSLQDLTALATSTMRNRPLTGGCLELDAKEAWISSITSPALAASRGAVAARRSVFKIGPAAQPEMAEFVSMLGILSCCLHDTETQLRESGPRMLGKDASDLMLSALREFRTGSLAEYLTRVRVDPWPSESFRRMAQTACSDFRS